MKLLTWRFQPAEPVQKTIAQQIAAIQDVQQLEELINRLLDVGDLDTSRMEVEQRFKLFPDQQAA